MIEAQPARHLFARPAALTVLGRRDPNMILQIPAKAAQSTEKVVK